MGKKGQGEKVKKKTEQKKIDKIIEDKTFGLKNKNKSKVVQKKIKGIANNLKGVNQKGGERALLEREFKDKQEKKKIDEKQNLIASLFKEATQINQEEAKAVKGQDSKSILCAFFKAGVCKKGKKCKFSHDLSIENKSAKIDLYSDVRRNEGMESWDQEYLEKVVEEKNKGRGFIQPSAIVCKYFLDAVEKKIYGWRWECPNGELCQYRHCLPPGFVLKSEKEKREKQDELNKISLEEEIEELRAQLPATGLTPVTLDTFKAWKEKKQKQKEQKIEEERKKESAKTGGKGFHILTGRALFQYDPNAFQDDEGALEEYDEEKEETEEESKKEMTKKEEKQYLQSQKEDTSESQPSTAKKIDDEEIIEKVEIDKELFESEELQGVENIELDD